MQLLLDFSRNGSSAWGRCTFRCDGKTCLFIFHVELMDEIGEFPLPKTRQGGN